MNEQSVQSTSDEFLPYVDFKDLPDTTTPIDATNLNVLQSLIKQDIEDIPDIPNGGTTGQVLAKASNTNGDVEWIDVEQAQVEDSLTSNSTTNAPSIHAVNTALNNIDLNFLKFKMMEKSNVTVSGNSSTSVDVGTFTIPDGYTFIGILPINNGYGDQWIVSYCRYNNSCVAMIDNHYTDSLTSQLRCCVLFVKTDYFNQNSIA